MTEYQNLLAQKAALDAQIATAQAEAKAKAVTEARVLIQEHGLTAADVFPQGKAKGSVCTTDSTVLHLNGSVHHFLEPNAFPPGAMTMYRVGKKAAGRLLDGLTWTQFPGHA